jgi:transposase
MAQVEVITSVQRRRRWSVEEKQRIVAESARPDRTVVQVARAHEITPNQLFTWRRQFLAASLAAEAGGDGFVPVQLAGPASSSRRLRDSSSAVEPRIAIRLASGVEISVGPDVEVESLRRVLAALAG